MHSPPPYMAARFHRERERERERERFFGVLVWSCSLARVLEKESRSEGKTEVKIF